MTTRWGFDQEERQAVAMKAQQSYSISRQNAERIGKLETDLADARANIEAMSETIGRLMDRCRAMMSRIEILESIDKPPKKEARLSRQTRELQDGRS